MGLFKKKADPISERSRALKEEIEALEAQIRQLSEQDSGGKPQMSSAATERAPALAPAARPVSSTPLPPAKNRVLKQISAADFKLEAEPVLGPDLDAAGAKTTLLTRILDELRGKPTTNPKLVRFLAAGSIQGLRPLRYEKRIARNRLIGLCFILLLLIWGILAVVLKNN